MGEHKVYNNRKNELIKKNRTKNILKITKNFMITIAVVLFLNQAVAFVTGYNLIWNGIKYVLNAADIYTSPVASISVDSAGWRSKEPGSWHIVKKAEWTGVDTAEVTFTLETLEKETVNIYEEVIPDVILVLDTSLSMEGKKLDNVKEQSKGFVETYLTKHPNKTIAVVDFDDEGRIVIPFTGDIEKLQEAIDTLVASGNTNYNDALNRVDDLMQIGDYADRNVGVLFLTDGVPCIDSPSEVATFKMIKEKYALIAFNGIQYEMGTRITDELRNISDYHKYATIDTLGDVFYELTQYTEIYQKFVITDYVKDKYFYINDVSDIETSYCAGNIGNVELINGKDGSQKVVWDLGDEYKTGVCSESDTKTTMKIKLTLRDEYVNDHTKDFYPTNDGEEIVSKLDNEDEYTKKSSDTPVLQRIYNVIYENNPPTGCNLPAINTTENHHFSEIVSIIDDKPTCPGYVFKDWEIVTLSAGKVGNDKFTMPTNNVTLRARWAKQDISKSMSGKTGEKPALYEIVKTDGTNRNGAYSYTGAVSDKFDVNSPSENATIYYYNSKSGNNVVFANICWIIVRTTSTGGVKLLYNGEYDEYLKCSDGRSGSYYQIGQSSFNYIPTSPADVGYMYNTRYTYSSGNVPYDTAIWGADVEYKDGMYTLKNTKTGGLDYSHHYVCADGTESCSTVRYYYYKSGTTYYYITLRGTANISTALEEMFGTSNYDDPINSNVNITSSAIKWEIDDWYRDNIDLKQDANGNSYTNYLEDVVFCNDRLILYYGAWNPNGGLTSSLEFNNVNLKSTYNCPRQIDQFSVSNEKAKLTYPVGLLTGNEANRLGTTASVTGEYWWVMTPTDFYEFLAYGRIVEPSGRVYNYFDASSYFGVRPSVSLKPGTKVSSGNGTMSDPYIVDKPAA